MGRRKALGAAFGKALALWEPPEGAGEARICIASTYTFDAAFFETECLGRFLGMDAHPAESDTVSYMVEREEKLATALVAVLVDRRNARDKESLRWDVLGVLVPGSGIQHSKISLLAWANHVRVIVGSGNLSEPGYRRNLEVFGALDIHRRDGGDRQGIITIIDFLREIVGAAVGLDATDGPKGRARSALDSVRALIARWPDVGSKNPRVILGGPGRAVFPQLVDAWPSGSPPRKAYVVSPFFDGDGREAATALLGVLAKRRPREVFFDVRTEMGLDGRTRVFAPLSLVHACATQADTWVHRVLPEQRGELRNLHAKMIHLGNDEWRLLMAGSSNFTRAGLGAGRTANFEANLAYRFQESDPETRVLEAVWPEVDQDPLDPESDSLVWDPQDEECEDGAASLPLPAAFEEASFVPGNPASLAITLRDSLPASWSVQADDGQELLSSAQSTRPGTHVLPWQGNSVPFVLQVTWAHEDGFSTSNWPVNVSNPAALPPPEALRSLTLDELLQVLASTRPIPQAVAEVFEKRKGRKKNGDTALDPLKRFDSQSHLLRRTKRLAAALERMRERLERPASSLEAFEWRLFGPVGPMALAEGYMREAGLGGEAKFCLAEIALALYRVRAHSVGVDGLSRASVTQSLKRAIGQLADRAGQIPPVPEIDRYAAAAFEEVTR